MARSLATTSSIDSFNARQNPTLARVATSGALPRYEQGVHYRLLRLESGANRRDLPIFTSPPGAVTLSDPAPVASRVDYPLIPGGFLLHDVLSASECDQLVKLSETLGYTEDAPVSLGRSVRQNENCVWLAPADLNDALFQRCRPCFPPEVWGGEVCGLNARWRLYKYNPSDIFRVHTDGSWPGSGLDASGQLVDDIFGDRWSQLTIVIYLNDEFEGGPTRFLYPVDGGERGEYRVSEMKAGQGGAVCFFHGQHPLSPLHEGGLVTSGTKYIIRSDVLYLLPKSEAVD